MPPPSQLSIATSSLQRLIKEEASYHSELEMQQRSIERLEKEKPRRAEEVEEEEEESGNHEFLLRQEVSIFSSFSFFPALLSPPRQTNGFFSCFF
jgi:tubulin-specific chaperone A